jgi:cyanophycinase
MAKSKSNQPHPTIASVPAEPGPVMIIGGAEDKLRDRVILTRFVSLAGGSDSHVAVISTASSLGDAATALYRELFTHMGAGRVSGLRPVTREEANEESMAHVIDRATAVFLTGGNQLRLASVVSGTRLGAALLQAHQRGVPIAGTSAGASAVSTHMVAFGASGASPKHRMAQISAGLGLLKGVVVDQHFEQRTRLGRLLAVVAQSPSLIGLGLDEDTAAIIYADETLEVIGKGSVTIVDGSQVLTDAFQTKGHRPMMVSGAILHSLPAGYWFDLRARQLVRKVDELGERQEKTAESARRRLARMAKQIAAEGANSFVHERRRRSSKQEKEASE